MRKSALAVLVCALAGRCDPAMGQTSGQMSGQDATSRFAAAIDRETKAIHAAEHADRDKRLPDAKLGAMWGVLGSYQQDAAQYAQAERSYTTALHLLSKPPEGKANYAIVLDNLGSVFLETGRLEEAENTQRNALAVRRELGDARAIAKSQGHLAEVELALHHFDAAVRDAQAASDTFASLNGIDPMSTPGSGNVAGRVSAMVTLSYALCSENRCADGLRVARQALEQAQSAFQPDAEPVGHALMAAGMAQWKVRQNADAEVSMRAGVQILKQHIASGSPVLVSAMMEYRGLLKSQKRATEIATLDAEMEAMRRGAPAECANCTVSAYGLMRAAK